MNFTSKNSRFSAIRDNEMHKNNKQRHETNTFNRDNSKSKNRRERNEKQTFQKKLSEPKPVKPPQLTLDYFPTLGEAVFNKPSQELPNEGVPKQETTWSDLIAKKKEKEDKNEETLNTIQPGWIHLRMDKKTHKIIREYGPPVEDSGWFARWQDHERMLKERRCIAYIEEQEAIRRELEPDYLYQYEDYSESEYNTDDEDILVEEECLTDESEGDY
jgi:hypothetical protein